MDKIRALRAYIIKNFIIILFAVAAAEISIVLLFNNLIFPALVPYISDELNLRDCNIRTVLVFLFYGLVRLGVWLISRYIPLGYKNYDEKLIEKMELFQGNKLVEGYESITPFIRFLLIFSIILVIILLILPILIAGSAFTARVVGKFSKLEEEEREKKNLYEQKRNLMLSDIAHDLRTPITTIYGYSQAVLDHKVSDEKRDETLRLICMKSKKVDELINLLFDYVKMDSDGFVLHKEKTDLAELVRQVGALLFQDVCDGGMELDADIPEEMIEIEADRVQFSRVVTNLLSNAIKHNRPGTVIGLILTGGKDEWRLYVADTGEAIDEKTAEDIFEPFITGDESRKSGSGSGLGLSIARKITALHGYDLCLLQGSDLPIEIKQRGFTKAFRIK